MSELAGPAVEPRTGEARQLVVLLHGLGADGNDLIGLAPVLQRYLPNAAFISPNAPEPCDMAPMGYQWFSLQDRRPDVLALGVERARKLLDPFLDDQLRRRNLADDRLALVGFSQGTMLSLHTAPRRAASAAAVVGFSGALIAPEKLGAEAQSRPPVLLVHGDADDVVPVDQLFAARAALEAENFPLQWEIRPGLPHGIDPEGLDSAGRFLQAAFDAG